jgi:hypothetical protein
VNVVSNKKLESVNKFLKYFSKENPNTVVYLQMIGSQTTNYVGNRNVQSIDFFHFCYTPSSFFPVPTHLGALVAGLAQGHHGVVPALLDVMGIAGARLAADRAWLFLDHAYPYAFSFVVTTVHCHAQRSAN